MTVENKFGIALMLISAPALYQELGWFVFAVCTAVFLTGFLMFVQRSHWNE